MKKALALLTMLIGASSLTIAQTADEIINKNIAAMGGLDKLNSIKSIYEEDSLFAGGAKIPVTLWMVNNKAMRAEFTFSGMTGYQILRNDSGWSFIPFQGQTKPEPMTGDQVKKGQQGLYVTDAFVNYKEKGYKVTYEGKDESEGSEAYKIKVTISDSISETYYIDLDTYYVIQVKSKATVNGKTNESTETRSDYKKTADGYVFPMESNSTDQGDTKTFVIKVNSPIDSKVFTPAVKVAGK
jgi:hypothetical protein